MPIRDGIQTIHDLDGDFSGKIIMISQVEDKQMVGKSYSLGVEYYITKPINRLEVVSVIQKVIEHIRLEKSVCDIRKTLNILEFGREKNRLDDTVKNITLSGQFLLTELGMIGESGSSDLLDMLEYLSQYEKQNPFDHEFPPLKGIFTTIATKKLGGLANQLH